MDETALALLVFNPQSESPFEGIAQWDRDLARAARRDFAKLLVAGRCDRGGLTVSRESIDKFAQERGFQQFLQTSAKTGEGCQELREAIERSIDWDSIPWTASPRIFKLLKGREALSDVKAILRARERGRTHLTCQYCDESIPLWDELEQEMASEKYEARVREMEATSRAGIDRKSRDLMVEYHAFAIAEETSQTFVPFEDEDLGVQARIDLLDSSGQPSDRCLHLQLRPRDIYGSVSTSDDGNTVFEIRSQELATQWQQSDSPVMLVHRTDDGYIRWMNVTDYLRDRNGGGKSPVRQIVFDGESFTALNLQRMRDRLIQPQV
jgi:hypothetical protein